MSMSISREEGREKGWNWMDREGRRRRAFQRGIIKLYIRKMTKLVSSLP